MRKTIASEYADALILEQKITWSIVRKPHQSALEKAEQHVKELEARLNGKIEPKE